jgi:hypothetical protein
MKMLDIHFKGIEFDFVAAILCTTKSNHLDGSVEIFFAVFSISLKVKP